MSDPYTVDNSRNPNNVMTTTDNTVQACIGNQSIELHRAKNHLEALHAKLFGESSPPEAAEVEGQGSSQHAEPLSIQQQININTLILDRINTILEDLTERV